MQDVEKAGMLGGFVVFPSVVHDVLLCGSRLSYSVM